MNVKRGVKYVGATVAVIFLVLAVGWLKANAADLLPWLLIVSVLTCAFVLGATKH